MWIEELKIDRMSCLYFSASGPEAKAPMPSSGRQMESSLENA